MKFNNLSDKIMIKGFKIIFQDQRIRNIYIEFRLAGPTRPEYQGREDDYDSQFAAMDIDEELQMKGQ
jgi:hypothetical protein